MAQAKKSAKAALNVAAGAAKDFLLEPSRRTEWIPIKAGSVTPSMLVKPDEHYVRVRLLTSFTPYQRTLLTSVTPCVYAGVRLRQGADGAADFARLLAPRLADQGFSAAGAAGSNVFNASGEILFDSTPFRCDLEIELALIAIKKTAKAKKALDFIITQSANAALPYADIAKPVINLVRDGLDLLVEEGSSIALGLRLTPQPLETGCYAILSTRRNRPDELNIEFDSARGVLRSSKTRRPLERPYIVISVEALESRPDAADIPALKDAWKALESAIKTRTINDQTVDEDDIKALFRRYCQIAAVSLDLLPSDRRQIVAHAKAIFEDYKNAGSGLESTLSRPAFEAGPGLPDHGGLMREALLRRSQAADVAASAGPPLAPISAAQAADEIDAAIRTYDEDALAGGVADLITAARADQTQALAPIKRAMAAMRRARRHKSLKALGDGLQGIGIDAPFILKFHAQGLIELGETDAAMKLLRRARTIARSVKDRTEEAEVLGLTGRIFKDRFVRSGDQPKANRARILDDAIDAYRDGRALNADPNDFYHTVNMIALAQAGANAGFKPKLGLNVRKESKRIGDYVTARFPDRTASWDCANAAEAALALKDDASAREWLARYASAAKGDPFALNSTLRQLNDLWGLKADAGSGSALAPLQLSMLAAEGGWLKVSPQTAQALAKAGADQGRLESTFGDDAGMAVQHAQKAIGRAEIVGVVIWGDKRIGTGFLVPGNELSDRLGEDLVFITNAHVASNDPANQAAPPEEIQVCFEFDDATKKYRVARQIWTSPPRGGHDCTILALDGSPAIKQAPVIAKGLPPRWRGLATQGGQTERGSTPRVLIIGHPRGGDLSITFDHNLLIDHEGPDPGQECGDKPVRIHYRAPTEPGNSGSPIFNARTLELMGIHHMGGAKPLHSDSRGAALYEANEGLWLQPIRKALDEFLAETPRPKMAAVPALESVGPDDELDDPMLGFRERYEHPEAVVSGDGLEKNLPGGKPSKTEIASEAIELILSSEISGKDQYQRLYQKPLWPKGESGLTIGVGYDLGYATPTQVAEDWGGAISSDIISRLVEYCGLHGAIKTSEAENQAYWDGVCRAVEAVTIPFDAAHKVFIEKMLPLYVGQTERAFKNAAALPRECLGALTSLVFNRGAGMGKEGVQDTRLEMRAIRDLMKAGNPAAVPQQILNMKRIWAGKPKMKGLLTRRNNEAALFQKGLAKMSAPAASPAHVAVGGLAAAGAAHEARADERLESI